MIMIMDRGIGDEDIRKKARLIARCDKVNDITKLNAAKFARYVTLCYVTTGNVQLSLSLSLSLSILC